MKKKELSYRFLLLKHMPYSLLMFLINENLLHAFMQNVESNKLSDVVNVMLETIIPGRFVFINAFYGPALQKDTISGIRNTLNFVS